MALRVSLKKQENNMKYPHIVAAVHATPWMITEEKLREILSFIEFKASGGNVSADEAALIREEQREPYLVMLDEEGAYLSEFITSGPMAGAVTHESSEGKDDSSAWDGPAAESRLRKWASSDGSGDKDKMDWAKYRRGFAWYDSADPESFGSYKLPHHDIKDGKFVVILRGVEAAMSALLGGRGGTSIPESDRKAVYNHLAAEYKEFGKEPPPYHGAAWDITVDASIEAQTINIADPSSASRSRAGAIAVLPLHGTISNRMGMMSEMSGGTSTERFSQWLKAALADPQVKSIVMDIDSPGGTVAGVQELADEIYKGRDAKPIVAVANSMAASAAYYLGSQASELVVTPSGEVGSIGVFAAHEDVSKVLENAGVKVSFISAGKYKTEANPYEPLSGDARDAMQAKVNEYYSQFTSAVARGRNVPKAQVESGFGEGRMVMAKDAVKQGMADRVASFDQTLARMGARTKAKILPSTMNRETAAEAPEVPIAAEGPQVEPIAAYRMELERRRRELELY
jgi:capsid assembly protease